MIKRLIVNADDFGLTRGVCEGIIETIERGIVRSTSLIANADVADYGLDLARKRSLECVGIHLNINFGRPLSRPENVPTLVDRDGAFFHKSKLSEIRATANLHELESEFELQIRKLVEAGFKPTHLNGNYDIHVFPEWRQIVFRLAKKYMLPVRRSTPELADDLQKNGLTSTDHYVSEFFGDNIISERKMLDVVSNLKEGTTEIGTHPGLFDNELKKVSSYTESRQREIKILTSPLVKKEIEAYSVALIGFENLKQKQPDQN